MRSFSEEGVGGVKYKERGPTKRGDSVRIRVPAGMGVRALRDLPVLWRWEETFEAS